MERRNGEDKHVQDWTRRRSSAYSWPEEDLAELEGQKKVISSREKVMAEERGGQLSQAAKAITHPGTPWIPQDSEFFGRRILHEHEVLV